MRAILGRWRSLLIAAACGFGLALAQAAQLAQPTSLLVDETGTLAAGDGEALLARLQQLQASGRAQAAILIARDTQGLPLADYSLQVAQAWKLGRAGRDDGLLVVVVPRAGAARIEVGYGLEGTIPDVLAARWIDTLLLPALPANELAPALHGLLDAIDAALPAAGSAPPSGHLLDAHPEWKLPFVLAVFSPFALFPLFFGRWGALASAPLFAAFMVPAAWLLWQSRPAAIAAGCIAFVLPLLWSLNHARSAHDSRLLVHARTVGNLAAVGLFFLLLLVFIGVGASHVAEAAWGAPIFAGTMALGLACVLFPGRPAERMMLVLRSVMHFVFILMLTYPAVMGLVSEPVRLSFTIAGAFAALIALSLWLERREGERRAAGEDVTRWSLWLIGLAVLILVPVGVLMLLQAVLGADFQTQMVQAAAGGGSIAGVLWWAARHGFFAALRIGLGGRFGGGGAEGRG